MTDIDPSTVQHLIMHSNKLTSFLSDLLYRAHEIERTSLPAASVHLAGVASGETALLGAPQSTAFSAGAATLIDAAAALVAAANATRADVATPSSWRTAGSAIDVALKAMGK
jgi:hypothetical protein